LGFICFPFYFTDLQVQKPASADLINSQFIINWEKSIRNFFPDFLTQARGYCHPQARIVRLSAFSLLFCPRAGAGMRLCPHRRPRI
jgi:hypothetical protein